MKQAANIDGPTTDAVQAADATNRYEAKQLPAELKLERINDAATNLRNIADAPGYLFAIRSQADNKGDAISAATALEPGEDVHTRQEFKDETDINNIMKRFGQTGMIATRQMEWGKEIDESIDLQQAIGAINQARAATFNVPPELKTKYPNWQTLLNAAESGEYAADLQELDHRKKASETARKEAEDAKKATPPEASPKAAGVGVT